MVKAQKMGKAMHGKVEELCIERFLLTLVPCRRLSAGRLHGNHDVAKECWIKPIRALPLRKREHIGRPILAGIVTVELLNLRIGAQHDAEFCGFFPCCSKSTPHACNKPPHRALRNKGTGFLRA